MGWGGTSSGASTPRCLGLISTPRAILSGLLTPGSGGGASSVPAPSGVITPRGGTSLLTPRSLVAAAQQRLQKPICSSTGFNHYFLPRLCGVRENKKVVLVNEEDDEMSNRRKRVRLFDPSLFGEDVTHLKVRVSILLTSPEDVEAFPALAEEQRKQSPLIVAEVSLALEEGKDYPIRTPGDLKPLLLKGAKQKISAYQDVLDRFFPQDLTSTPVHCLLTAPLDQCMDENTDERPDIDLTFDQQYDLKEDPYAYEAMRVLPPPLLRHKEKPLLRFIMDKAPNARHHIEMRAFVPKPTKHAMERLKKRPAASVMLNRYTYIWVSNTTKKFKSDLFPFPRESRRMRFETPQKKDVVVKFHFQEDWDHFYALYDLLLESPKRQANHAVVHEDTVGFIDKFFEKKIVRESGGVTREMFDLCHRVMMIDETMKKALAETKEQAHQALMSGQTSGSMFLNSAADLQGHGGKADQGSSPAKGGDSGNSGAGEEPRHPHGTSTEGAQIASTGIQRDVATGLPYYDPKSKKFLFGMTQGSLPFKAVEDNENLRDLVENHLLQTPSEPLHFLVQIVDHQGAPSKKKRFF
ncbi:unnamed protein product [Amoebophrya sp. A25]|nr:unnamed protein product [Amoebophrya sp. A25]|eukprot:GSA25T00001345001.1